MRKELTAGLFSGLVLLQIAAPVSLIVQRESVLKQGTPFRFKTAPVDPYDAFRGRYVALKVEANTAPKPQGLDVKYGQKVYAQLAVDEHGFAKVARITTQKPQGSTYVTATVSSPVRDGVALDLPIDRYYMEEKSAPRAEQAYREHSGREVQDAYVVVRIKDGFAVIEGLYVGGRRIEEVVKQKT